MHYSRSIVILIAGILLILCEVMEVHNSPHSTSRDQAAYSSELDRISSMGPGPSKAHRTVCNDPCAGPSCSKTVPSRTPKDQVITCANSLTINGCLEDIDHCNSLKENNTEHTREDQDGCRCEETSKRKRHNSETQTDFNDHEKAKPTHSAEEAPPDRNIIEPGQEDQLTKDRRCFNPEHLSQEDELESLRASMRCKVCLTNQVQVLFLSCSHLICCEPCSGKVAKCPVCRSVIRSRLQVYML